MSTALPSPCLRVLYPLVHYKIFEKTRINIAKLTNLTFLELVDVLVSNADGTAEKSSAVLDRTFDSISSWARVIIDGFS
jgi:hypothetical protein